MIIFTSGISALHVSKHSLFSSYVVEIVSVMFVVIFVSSLMFRISDSVMFVVIFVIVMFVVTLVSSLMFRLSVSVMLFVMFSVMFVVRLIVTFVVKLLVMFSVALIVILVFSLMFRISVSVTLVFSLMFRISDSVTLVFSLMFRISDSVMFISWLAFISIVVLIIVSLRVSFISFLFLSSFGTLFLSFPVTSPVMRLLSLIAVILSMMVRFVPFVCRITFVRPSPMIAPLIFRLVMFVRLSHNSPFSVNI